MRAEPVLSPSLTPDTHYLQHDTFVSNASSYAYSLPIIAGAHQLSRRGSRLGTAYSGCCWVWVHTGMDTEPYSICYQTCWPTPTFLLLLPLSSFPLPPTPLLHTPRQMLVQWTTRDSRHPVVKWGTKPGQYTHTTSARSSTYTVRDMCGPPADSIGWVDPGTFHAALLEGLEPGTLYHYVVGDEVGHSVQGVMSRRRQWNERCSMS